MNGVFRASCWLYAQTPHGHEGYLRYSTCLPLGILPAATAASAACSQDADQVADEAAAPRRRHQDRGPSRGPCWDTASDIFPFRARPVFGALDLGGDASGNRTDTDKMRETRSERQVPTHKPGGCLHVAWLVCRAFKSPDATPSLWQGLRATVSISCDWPSKEQEQQRQRQPWWQCWTSLGGAVTGRPLRARAGGPGPRSEGAPRRPRPARQRGLQGGRLVKKVQGPDAGCGPERPPRPWPPRPRPAPQTRGRGRRVGEWRQSPTRRSGLAPSARPPRKARGGTIHRRRQRFFVIPSWCWGSCLTQCENCPKNCHLLKSWITS